MKFYGISKETFEASLLIGIKPKLKCFSNALAFYIVKFFYYHPILIINTNKHFLINWTTKHCSNRLSVLFAFIQLG